MNRVQIEQFVVQGKSVRTNNAQEATDAGKIPGLWGEFYTSHPDLREVAYGVYSDYESDASGDFTVFAGIKAGSSGEATVTVGPGTYLEFPALGAMPAAVIDAWKAVWAHFSTPRHYARTYETDFEQYTGPESAVVYIGISEGS